MTTENPVIAPQPVVAETTSVDIFGSVWLLAGYWHLLLVASLAGLLCAAIYLHLATYRYTASLQLAPSEQAAPALSRNLSGLASLAGVGLPKSQVSQYSLLLETLRGRDVALLLAQDPVVMHTVFSKDWDAINRRWRQPADTLAGVKSGVKALLGVPNYGWHVPSGADLQEFMGKKIGVDEDTKKALATVSYSDADPVFAMHLIDTAVATADLRLRQRALRRTSDYIAYLQQKLATVSVADQRDALLNALSEQEKQRMMASATQPFAADPVGTVSASLRPTSPSPWLVLAIGLGGGLAAGIVLAFLRHARLTKQ